VTDLAIDLRGVKKSFGARTTLEGFDLAIPAGTVAALLGANGAGKTTTLRILLGLLRADGGATRVLGLDPSVDAPRVRASVGALLENDGLYDRLTAEQNLDYHARIHRVANRVARIEERLRACGLFERRKDRVATFSKGMRQKLAIARALLHDPKLVLLDEPFTGLDPGAAADLREAIGELARAKVTVLLTTHDLAHVERACDTIAIVDGGRVVARGSPQSLAEGGDEIFVRVSGAGLDEALLAKLRDEGAIASFAMNGSGARVACTRDQRKALGVLLVQRGVVLEELATERASLEQTFLAHVGRGGAGA
jgi:ABC-2 type transport system ATP-binding protein